MIYLALLHAATLLTIRALMISKERNKQAIETHKKMYNNER